MALFLYHNWVCPTCPELWLAWCHWSWLFFRLGTCGKRGLWSFYQHRWHPSLIRFQLTAKNQGGQCQHVVCQCQCLYTGDPWGMNHCAFGTQEIKWVSTSFCERQLLIKHHYKHYNMFFVLTTNYCFFCSFNRKTSFRRWLWQLLLTGLWSPSQ